MPPAYGPVGVVAGHALVGGGVDRDGLRDCGEMVGEIFARWDQGEQGGRAEYTSLDSVIIGVPTLPNAK